LDFRERVKQLRANGNSLSEITKLLMPEFPDLTEHQVWEKVHGATRNRRSVKMTDKPIGVFSDPHIPFNHPNYLQFLVDTFKKYNVGQIVCCGDLVDNHAISRHLKETSSKSACDELDMSIGEVAKFTKAFPKVKMCYGNHDSRVEQQAATVGIDRRYLKSQSELLELPKTWELADEFIINDVLFKHGINCLGVDGAYNAAIRERMSTVIGHAHAFAGCKYQANKREIIFGMNVGCGIDIDAYAFAYGKHDKNRPILGCGIVYDSGHAEFIPMGLEYFRN
jgi:predicted phosphodiesterase